MIAEIIGPSGRVHYRRPVGHPMVKEAQNTPGYEVRFVDRETDEAVDHPPLDIIRNFCRSYADDESGGKSCSFVECRCALAAEHIDRVLERKNTTIRHQREEIGKLHARLPNAPRREAIAPSQNAQAEKQL